MPRLTKVVEAYNKSLFEQGLIKCNVCKEIKPLDEFHEDKLSKDGRQSGCKGCRKQYQKNYQPQYYEDNRERVIRRNKQYRQDNKERLSEWKRQYDQDNKEEIKEYNKKYKQDNKEKINVRHKERYYTDPCYKLRLIMSNSINTALKGGKGGESFLPYVDWTIPEFKEHLESQFEDWMTWDNHGVCHPTEKRWQIDHIKPQSVMLEGVTSMDNPKFRECWALENLRPLEARENISKGNKILYEDFIGT